MNDPEAVLFLAMVRAAFPAAQPVAGQGDQWAKMLRDVSLEEAELALTAWGRVEERIPTAAAIRSYVRAAREQEAQAAAARRALASDGRRHKMPAWFRGAVAQHASAAAGKYAELHEARRERERAEGRELAAWEPMPGFLAGQLEVRGSREWQHSTERSPQDRAAGPDA